MRGCTREKIQTDRRERERERERERGVGGGKREKGREK